MPEELSTETALSARRRAVEHREGPLLVLGAPGTGKTELLARRLAHLVAAGAPPEGVLMIAPPCAAGPPPGGVLMPPPRRATAERLRGRCEALLEGSFEELWIGSWDAIG